MGLETLNRVTQQVVPNLPLTSKQKFHFGMTGGLELPAVSPCIYLLIVWQINELKNITFVFNVNVMVNQVNE